MPLGKKCPLSYLEFLVRNGQAATARRKLYAPDFSLLDNLQGADPEILFHSIKNIDPVLADFIRLYVLTGFLLYPEKRDAIQRQWLKNHAPAERFFPAHDFDFLADARWCAVPIGVVDAESTCIYYLICGLHASDRLTLLPAWAARLFDNEARKSINTAAEAAKKLSKKPTPGLAVYPLLPDRGEIQLTGSSLGLPLAVGFYSLIKNSPINDSLAMTGTINADGAVTRVEALDQKIELFRQKKFAGIIYPTANGLSPYQSRQDCFPISDLNQALVFCDLYAPEKAENLQTFWQMLNNARTFVNNADIARPDWLKLAHENKWAKKTVDSIARDPVLFLQLSEKLDACGDKFQLDQGNALSRFISPKALPKALDVAPLAAFKWCTANLALANHQGDVSGSDKWAEAAKQFRAKALTADINEMATFYNHYLVSRHNLYAFKPIIPSMLKKTLQCLESQHKSRRKAGNRTFIVLGRLYGTLAQHFAFCGPSHLAMVEAYFKKARKALGENTVPEYKEEWMRQYSYLTYALISAGKMKQAQATLFKYCEISGWEQLPSKSHNLSSWQHAMLARFLAETRRQDIQSKYLNAKSHYEPGRTTLDHPWQLWYWNMGRIAFLLKEDDLAGSLMAESLRRCLALKAGPTINVMALMPLSYLQYYKMISATEIKAAEKQVRQAAENLDRKHFSPLRKKSFTAVLEQTRKDPATLFPFAYR